MIKANEELRQYWHPTKGGWHIGIVEAVRQTKDGPVLRIRPIKPAMRCLDVQAEDTKGI